MSRSADLFCWGELAAMMEKMQDSGETSPYFDKRQCTRHNRHAGSSYFVRSPSSALGSVQSLRPFIFNLTKRDVPECCRQHPTASCKNHSLACESCSPVIGDAVNHFQSCSIFQKGWESWSSKKVSYSSDCWKEAEAVLEYSVRHLCPHRCYMRAYAPFRGWLSLRVALREQTDTPLDEILAEWHCRLIFDSDDFMPRTAFYDQNGESFYNIPQVLKHLNAFCLSSDTSSNSLLSRKRRLFLSSMGSSPAKCSTPPDICSPLGLLEELFDDDPWCLLLSTILLNRTSRVQVDSVMFAFLEEWPTAAEASQADAVQMSLVIQPLGLRFRRAAGIIRFSKEYRALLSKKVEEASGDLDEKQAASQLTRTEVLSLYNCGEYAYAAYQIFILKDLNIHPEDRVLQAYVEYKRGERGST